MSAKLALVALSALVSAVASHEPIQSGPKLTTFSYVWVTVN